MRIGTFGRLGGRDVAEAVLESAAASVSIIGFGASIRDWRVDGAVGTLPVVLGFGRVEDYAEHARAHGAVVGRVANRTAGAEFELDGQRFRLTRNHGDHHLHGSLHQTVWEMEGDGAAEAVRLSHVSPDGADGFPGRVAFEVLYRLEGARLVCEMAGLPDRATPVNLASHAYFDLGGGAGVRDHLVRIEADRFTPVDAALIPTGAIEAVAGTRFDFREGRRLEAADPEGRGFDQNLVLREDRDREAPAARVRCARTGLELRIWTDQPGLQLFDAKGMEIAARGHDGARYGSFAGLCLEAQHFPDSLHHPDWPSVIVTPERPYFQRLEVEIGPG